MKEDVVIVGAGIAGLAPAIALKRVGVQALVLEKTHELRSIGATLTLFPNAWSALHTLGVSKKLKALYKPYKTRFVTDVSSGVVQEVSFTGSDGTKAGPRGVHRKILLETLAGELPTGTIRFSTKISSIRTHTDRGFSVAILYLDDGTIINAEWLGLSTPVDSGRGAVRGLSVFPRGHGLDEEMKSGDPKLIQKNVIESFANLPAVFLDVVQHSDLSTLTWAPLMFRVPWNLIFGKLSKGNITVAGDAMHPMTPDLGQGGAAALEDAVVLGRHIGNSFHEHGQIVSGEVTKALELYVKERKWRCAGCDSVLSMVARWLGLSAPVDSGHGALLQCSLMSFTLRMTILTWAPLMFRVPWKLIFGKLSNGNITVAGDAMHSMTPDLGQRRWFCAALEDAVVLRP
ncbi:hypothetical protein GIB67_036128 [Kingdonia uniflora]|uniref:FAD-binding domain-containing protein n=1 Tax=Kingdonia uniflora TaxID=39325 RepID=A0A7J7N9V5_9MAGN|nr:hypothetical protein GIB67_036128 [Kingdonia uniflora]